MRKLLTFFALALLTLTGCKNSFAGNTAEQKIPANANVVLTLASPERTIAPGKLSEILDSAAKTEEWTFTFTRTDEPTVQDVITYPCAASKTTASFPLPTGTYDITAELSYTDATADKPYTYTIEGKLTGVKVSDTPVRETINIAFKKTAGGTGTLNYTFDFSGWGQFFTGEPVLHYGRVKHGGAVADVEWQTENLYNTGTTADDGSTTTTYLKEYPLNMPFDSGYWDISAYVTGYNADDPKLVYNIPINDNLVEIADGLTSTGRIVVPTPDTSKLYYVSCETDQQYNNNNGTFEFSRVSLSKAFEKATSLKPSIKKVTFSLDKLKGDSLELDASVLATGKTIHFQIASTGASFEITPEGHLESATGLTSVTFDTTSASEKTVNVAQSFIENSYSNTPLDIKLKSGVSLNCILLENYNGVRMNLHVYGIENYLTSPVITLNSTAPCNTTNTFYDAAGTDKTKDYILSKKTVEVTGTADVKTEYFIVPAGSGILGTETITDLSVTCAYGSEAPSLTKTGYKFTGTASYDYGDEITFTAKADNAASYVWSCFNTNTDQRETLSELDTGTCIVNIKKTKAINDDGVITMLVTAADSDGNATSYAVEFTVTGSTTTSRYILWDRSGYYAVSEDALTSDLSLSSQTSLGHTVLDFGFDADMNLYTLDSGNSTVLNYYTNGLKGFSITSSANASNTNISKIAITSKNVYASGDSSSSDSSSGGSYLNKFELPLKEGSPATDMTSSWSIPDTGEGISNYVFNSLAADDTYLYIGCKDKSPDTAQAPLYVVKYDLNDLNTIAGIAKLDTSNLVKTADGVDTSLTTDITDMLVQDGKLYVLAAVYYKVDTGYCSKFNGNMYEIDPASITDTTVTDSMAPLEPIFKFNKPAAVTVNDKATTISNPYPSKFVAVMPKMLKIAIDGGTSTTIGGITEHTDEDYVVTYDIAGKTATGVKFNNKMFNFSAEGSGFTNVLF